VFQPYISIVSDRSHHPWGRRKPFILIGTILTIIFMCLLPRTDDYVRRLFLAFESDDSRTEAVFLRGFVTVSVIWGLNVAIQPVQMGIRTLIIDTCPPHQQIQAAAYTSYFTGIGSVLGYTFGFIKLSQWLPWFGDTQFKCLSVVASLALGSTVSICLTTIEEKNIVYDIERDKGVGIFKHVLRSTRLIPKNIKRICIAQLFAWMGWFPFLFYSTT
jgi:solute carrier family 45 protein 1/2/4